MAGPRNIILISVDDGIAFWRYRNVFGERLQTPNLDRLFDLSTAFTSAYCQSPICGPSRASMLSGRSPYETGIVDNYTRLYDVIRPDHLWQFRLRQKGFYCSTAGKIHHAFQPQPPVLHDVLYSHPPKPLNIMPPLGRKTPVKKFGGIAGGPGTTDPKDDALYYDHQSADDAIAFLENYDSETPFYREIGFLHPHLPYKTPIRFKEMYREDAFTYPKDWERGFDLADFPQNYILENFPTDDQDWWRKSVRNYFSAYSHMDYHLGRVLDALMASAHANNTLVVLFADHGYHLGDKNRFRKSTLYEECTRVPLLIYDPSNPGGEVTDPVGLIDIGPTILDYAGCPPLEGSPGRSLRSAVETKTADPDRGVPSFKFGSVGMRKGPWRLNLYPDGGAEFHNVEEDMWLNENLAHRHPEFPQMQRDLVALAGEWGLDLGSLPRIPGPRPTTLPSPGQPGRPALRHFRTDLSDFQGAQGGPALTTELYTAMNPESHFEISPATRQVKRGSDGVGQAKHVTITGNLQDNEITLVSGMGHYTVGIDTGPGDNQVLVSHEVINLQCGSGNNHVTAGGGGVVRGGPGNDTFFAGNGETELHGGPRGYSEMAGRNGITRVFSGHGTGHIRSGNGETIVTVSGGSFNVDLRNGRSVLHLKRTGLPQIIRFGAGEASIDLSDWAGLGPAHLTPKGKAWELDCGTEHVLLEGADLARLKDVLQGHEVIFPSEQME